MIAPLSAQNPSSKASPSPSRKIPVSAQGQPYQIIENSLQKGLARIPAIYRESMKSKPVADCSVIAISVGQRIKLDPSLVLEIVEREVGANPACSCEVVKTAITASNASAGQVIAIIEAASNASPESMRIISQCAMAARPDSIAGVQAWLAKFAPNAGQTSDSAKIEEVSSISVRPLPNPLDLP